MGVGGWGGEEIPDYQGKEDGSQKTHHQNKSQNNYEIRTFVAHQRISAVCNEHGKGNNSQAEIDQDSTDFTWL